MRKELYPGGVLLWDIGFLAHSTLPTYHDAVYRLLERIPDIYITSDNSEKLDGVDRPGILKPIQEEWNAHVKRVDNPHKESAKSLGLLVKAEVDELLTKKVTEGLIPISWYGLDPTNLAEMDVSKNIVISGKTVTLPKCSVVFNGKLYEVPARNFTVNTGATLNIYVKLQNGVPKYLYHAEVNSVAETNVQMFVGKLVNVADKITYQSSAFTRVGMYRTSFSPVGTAFPIGLGGPNNTTEGIHLDWKPYKVGISLLRWDTGVNGFTSSTQDGILLLVADAGLNPNLYFDVIGEIVNVTSKVETIAGSGGNITKVNNSNFRVGLDGYGNFKVTFRATIHNGKWEEVSVYFLFRNLLKLWLSSTTLESAGGNSYTARANRTYYMDLGIGGDKVTTSHILTNHSGTNPTIVKESENRYRIVTSDTDNRFSISFSARDMYGRSISTPVYSVDSRKALPPNPIQAELFNTTKRQLIERIYGDSNVINSRLYTANIRGCRSGGRCQVRPYEYELRYDLRVAVNPGHTVRFLNGSAGYNTIYPTFIETSRFKDPRWPEPMFVGTFKLWGNTNQKDYYGKISYIITNELGEQRTVSLTARAWVGRYGTYWSCFTADTLVTMADMSTKRMVDVKKGDMVWTPFGPKVCSGLFKTKLGHRPLVSFGGKAKTSAEHSMWGRKPGTDDQFWCTRDMYGWIMEARTGYGPQFGNQLPVDLEDMKEWEFATINGWSKESWDVDYDVDPETTLYNVEFEEGSIYCVDGYLTSTMASVNCDVDWSSVKWDGKDITYNKRDRTPKDFVFDYPKVLPSKYHGFLFDEDTIRELQQQILEGYKDGDN